MEMVIAEGGCPLAKKCRSRPRKKLRVNERVEVRSQEDGFLGSWHQGIVIACGHRRRCIKYDHMVDEDGSASVVEHVEVPPAVDGVDFDRVHQCNYRGSIRPLPPYFVSGPWDLPYGLCVDVYYMEAWWEGVIFDHIDRSEERIVFFPDLGDEMSIRLANIRVTMIWNEATEGWHRRGPWIFLEVIEEIEQEWHLPVSVKQIWYDLREREDFIRIEEWTSSDRAQWQDMILKTISMNLKVALQVALPHLVMPRITGESSGLMDVPEMGHGPQAEKVNEGCIGFQGNLPGPYAVTKFSKGCEAIGLLDSPSKTGFELVQTKHGLDSLTADAEACSNESSMICDRPRKRVHTELRSPISQSLVANESFRRRPIVLSIGVPAGLPVEKNAKAKKLIQRNHSNWQPIRPDLVPGIGPHPNAIASYIEGNKGMKHNQPVVLDVRKHFLYLGWKIEFRVDKEVLRFRYISPEGKSYLSLVKACIDISGMIKDPSPIRYKICYKRKHSTSFPQGTK